MRDSGTGCKVSLIRDTFTRYPPVPSGDRGTVLLSRFPYSHIFRDLSTANIGG